MNDIHTLVIFNVMVLNVDISTIEVSSNHLDFATYLQRREKASWKTNSLATSSWLDGT